ncbi:MAG: copper homeostasis protein CutC [Clostridia bacterium]|nr:copper homeostasis protein CutC [Clostridia bacterium]
MSHILIEACCASEEDVRIAALGGADRIELNSALALGGLTPSAGTLTACRQAVSLPILSMIRPREGGFCYAPSFMPSMEQDVRILTGEGADGIVFGFLTPSGEIDRERTRSLMRCAAGCQTVFHRAFDLLPDWRKGLETLIDLGVTRVLTSGQAPSAVEGIPQLREMIRFAGDAIEILPAGGVRPDNAVRIVEETRCTQLHLSGSLFRQDPSWRASSALWFSSTDAPDGGAWREACLDIFRGMRDALAPFEAHDGR